MAQVMSGMAGFSGFVVVEDLGHRIIGILLQEATMGGFAAVTRRKNPDRNGWPCSTASRNQLFGFAFRSSSR